MKQYINEAKQFQKLAGIIKENLENDDIIYDTLVGIRHEQLVSDMMAAAESDPSLTLIDFLRQYDSSGEMDELYEGEAKITPDNRVKYLAHTLETIWQRGRGNNKIDYISVATSLIEDMFGSDEQEMDELYEVQLSPVNQKLKEKYIEDYMSQVIDDHAGEYYDDLADMDDIEAHAAKFGYTDTLRTIDRKVDTDLQNQRMKQRMKGPEDQYRREPVITKKGKMHKYDVDALKDKLKSKLGLEY